MAKRPLRIADVLGFAAAPQRNLTQQYARTASQPMPRSSGAVKADKGTVSRRIAQAITPNTRLGNEYANKIASLLDMITITGAEEPAIQARGAFGRGDYGQALGQGILAAASAIPGVGKVGGKAAKEAAETALERGIIAYHGSPYSFDKFSLDKIGTGEGAQAYGKGLYFADKEDVAKNYRDALKAKGAYKQEAKLDDPTRVAGELYESWNGDIRGALDDAKYYDNSKEIIKALKKIQDNPPAGSMYQVRINANPDQFMDWDKPITEQPEAVKRALQPFIDQRVASLEAAGQAARNIAKEQGLPDFEPKSTDKILSGLLGGDIISFAKLKNMTGIEEALRNSGVPGIKYKDAGSRGSSDVTRNYVVLDDALIDILKKYGIAIPAIAGGGLLATQPQQDGGL